MEVQRGDTQKTTQIGRPRFRARPCAEMRCRDVRSGLSAKVKKQNYRTRGNKIATIKQRVRRFSVPCSIPFSIIFRIPFCTPLSIPLRIIFSFLGRQL